MFPFLPSIPNNGQAPAGSGLAPQQAQLMPPNFQHQMCRPCIQSNPVGFVNTQPIQPQMHAHQQFQSPQITAFNNQNMENVQGSSVVVPNPLQMASSVALAGAPNTPFALQTSLISMQAPQGCPSLQNPQNVNQVAALPFHGQICNPPQALNQFGGQQFGGQFGTNQVFSFPQSVTIWPNNFASTFNQIMSLQSQLCSQNPMQALINIQQLPQHAFSTIQPGLFNVPQTSFPLAAAPVYQNTFLSNPCLGSGNAGSSFGNSLVSAGSTKSKVQGQDTSIRVVGADQNVVQNTFTVMQAPLSNSTAVTTKANDARSILPSDSIQLDQVNYIKNSKGNSSAAKFVNSASRNFNRDHHATFRRDQSHGRFQKHNHKTASGSFPSRWNRGQQNGRKPEHAMYENRRFEGCKRRAVSYTEEEIKQWCEARKRNFPTSANIERKKVQSNGNHHTAASDENEMLRRQQLKEVLVKQMELGFEAAEVPPHYLSDPENILTDRNRRQQSRTGGRFPDRNGKRGRHGAEKWQAKRQKPRDEASPAPAPRKREPTLFQKLLSSEIKRDQSRLLQAFRFLTINHFFEHPAGTALRYPEVVVKDLGCEVDNTRGKLSPGAGKSFGTEAEEVIGGGPRSTGAGTDKSTGEDDDGDGESVCLSNCNEQGEEAAAC